MNVDGRDTTAAGRAWRAFRRIWAGASISVLGDQITLFAVPTIAILTFRATPAQAGLIGALALLTYPVAGLFVGAVTDRVPKRPAIIVASVARILLLGLLGLTAATGVLSLWLLGAIVVASALCGVVADVGFQSLLPQIVIPEQLGKANARLESSRAIAQISGPGCAGLLITGLGPAAALFADSLSFVPLIGALAKWGAVPGGEPARAGRTWSPRAMLTDIRDALRFMRQDAVLWRLPATAALSNFGGQVFRIAFLIEAYRVLGFSAERTGFVLGFMGAGAVIGSFMTTFLVARVGERRLMTLTIAGEALALIPVAFLSGPAALPMACCCFFVAGMIGIPWNAVSKTVRMRRTPAGLQGRVNATARTLALTGSGLGALSGGICVTAAALLLGGAAGARAGVIIGAVIAGLGLPLLVRAPSLATEVAPDSGAGDSGAPDAGAGGTGAPDSGAGGADDGGGGRVSELRTS